MFATTNWSFVVLWRGATVRPIASSWLEVDFQYFRSCCRSCRQLWPARPQQGGTACFAYAQDTRIADIAHDFSLRPKTWAALAKTYETVIGIMSGKQDPQKARGDYKHLVEKKVVHLRGVQTFL